MKSATGTTADSAVPMTLDPYNSPNTLPDVRSAKAPVMQLLYAHYYLTRPPASRPKIIPDWKLRLERRDPRLVEELANQYRPGERRHFFMVLACELGYWDDANAGRFLTDLPTLPGRLLKRIAAHPELKPEEGLDAALHQLLDTGSTWPDQLRRLSLALIDEWRETGLSTVENHQAQFDSRFAETGDIIKSLPPYHFTRFEETAASIRTAEGQQEIVVIPLYYAAAGGFSFESGGRQFVGFGLRSEHVFEDIRARVDREARKIKALSDPTRLLLLTLVARYSGFSLTVGDLAEYLGVSQPTVSGHLKILREAGLVYVDRQGNKSFYRPDTEAMNELLTDMADTLLAN